MEKAELEIIVAAILVSGTLASEEKSTGTTTAVVRMERILRTMREKDLLGQFGIE